MSRSRIAVLLLAAAFLAAPLPRSYAAPAPPSGAALVYTRGILEDNDPLAAVDFLDAQDQQDAVKASDPDLYRRLFSRATELKDLRGLLIGAVDPRSIRLGLLRRQECSFCLDSGAFSRWAGRWIPNLPKDRAAQIEEAYWNWDTLEREQREWLRGKGHEAAWGTMKFPARHQIMREWALLQCDGLLKLNPSDADALKSYRARARLAHQALGNHEMTDVWRRAELASQAIVSTNQARAKLGANPTPDQKKLLDEAANAEDPLARLAALSKLFEGLGETPRDLLEAAPPRADQRFDDKAREQLSLVLKTALLKETEGTFAGEDLKAFYARTPMSVSFAQTSMSALGWYSHGTDVLNFNERYIEEYVKSNGASVADLLKGGPLLQNLARTLSGTFVHEAQHHRQDVWSRDMRIKRQYHQGDEVEAFQTQALFLLQKLRQDPGFRAFAEGDGQRSEVLWIGLQRARRLEENGPDHFDYSVPNGHYPEILSNEAHAWCSIVWHNKIGAQVQAELQRRGALAPEAQAALAGAPALADSYPTPSDFAAALLVSGTPSLMKYAAEREASVDEAAETYRLYSDRQKAVRRITDQRFEILELTPSVPEPRKRFKEPPSPGKGNQKR